MWSLNEVHQIGELSAALAVVLSLLFVGYEIQQNNQRQVQATTQTVVSEFSATLQSLSEDSGLACVYVRGIRDYSELAANQQVMFNSFLVRPNRIFEDVYYLRQEGSIDPRIWAGIENSMHSALESPGWQEWFRGRRHWYGAEYQAYLSELMASSPDFDIPPFEDYDCETA